MVQSDQYCTSTTTDTCIIDRTTEWNDITVGDIRCNDTYSKCIITCSGADLSCGSAIDNPRMICPTGGDSCIINCNSV